MQRWREVFTAAQQEAQGWHCTDKQAHDYAQVAAWLDMFAQMRRLRITRTIAGKYNEYAQHKVSILEEVDGELETLECGGYAEMGELRRSGDADWPFEKEELENGWVRLDIMITDMFPVHEMFQRSDGSRIDLGFHGEDHYHVFSVTMHKDDLIDEHKGRARKPLYQCADCKHPFTQLQCHIHAHTDGTCAESCMKDTYVEKEKQIHHCPHCKTHNSTWVAHST